MVSEERNDQDSNSVLSACRTAAGRGQRQNQGERLVLVESAPKSEWARDFKNMADMGFTHVALCWGLDAAAWTVRKEDTKNALDYSRRAGIGVYFIVWHPTHNSLPRKPEFQQMDVAGRLRFSFDTFNEQWRQTQWKEYLQAVAKLYSHHPAFSGYIFDDTFIPGPIDNIAGPAGKPEERYISYNQYDKQKFGKEPPRTASDKSWAEWTEARAKWWVDWAQDTMRFLREVDHDANHEIYLEDTESVLSQEVKNTVGVDFGRVAQPWDAVGAYTEPRWDGTPESNRKAVEHTKNVLARTRSAVGPEKKIIYTFWVANVLELRNPGPAKYPTAAQIKEICEAALSAGVRHLDMYGYRIGDFVVTAQNWPEKRPGPTGDYKLTDQYPKKHLYDRVELHEELKTYLRSLTSGNR